jgi:crotonobetainyl-CoA:carnitine CoA-transferase CaiB-like acyl-CoA transferase
MCGSDIEHTPTVEVPGHGEHTDALLEAAGLSEADIERLREDGAVR